MRMWMVPPQCMCRQHLLGEHVECHMFVGTLKRGVRLEGYASTNLLEITSLQRRHDELVAEMLRRGYTHASPLLVPPAPHVTKTKINRPRAWRDLLKRCEDCQRLYVEAVRSGLSVRSIYE